jgi:hypothetical protein
MVCLVVKPHTGTCVRCAGFHKLYRLKQPVQNALLPR